MKLIDIAKGVSRVELLASVFESHGIVLTEKEYPNLAKEISKVREKDLQKAAAKAAREAELQKGVRKALKAAEKAKKAGEYADKLAERKAKRDLIRKETKERLAAYAAEREAAREAACKKAISEVKLNDYAFLDACQLELMQYSAMSACEFAKYEHGLVVKLLQTCDEISFDDEEIFAKRVHAAEQAKIDRAVWLQDRYARYCKRFEATKTVVNVVATDKADREYDKFAKLLGCAPLANPGYDFWMRTTMLFGIFYPEFVYENKVKAKMDINAARKQVVYGQRTAFDVPLLKVENVNGKMLLVFEYMRQADCVLVRHGYVSDQGKIFLPLTVRGKNVLKEREHASLDLIEVEGSALGRKVKVEGQDGKKEAYLSTIINRNNPRYLARLICGTFDGVEYFGFYVPYKKKATGEIVFLPIDVDLGDEEGFSNRALSVDTVKALAAWAADHEGEVIYERYVNFAVSVAGQRRKTYSFLRVQDKRASYQEIANICKDALDSIHLGAFSFLQACNNGVALKITKGIKKSARLTLALTNSSRGGKVGRIAIFGGEFKTHKGGKLSRDGNGLFSAEWFIRFCRQEMGIYLTLDDARALGLQGRVATIKAFFLSKTNEELELIIREFVKNYGLKVMFVAWPKKGDAEGEKALNELFCRIENGELEDTVIMLGCDEDDYKVDMFVDMCALKCLFDMNGFTDSKGVHHSMTLNIMAIEKRPNFRMKTSNQILGGCMEADGFLEFAIGLGMAHIDRALAVKKDAPKNISSYRDVAGYFGDTLLANLNRDLAYRIPEARASIVDNMLKANLRNVNRFNFETSGFYAKMLPEPAFWFCGPESIVIKGVEYESISAYLLRTKRTTDEKGNVWVHVECFSPDVAGGVKAIGIRHPKLSPGEYLNITFVSRKLMYKRIAELLSLGLISEKVATYLRNCFRHLKSSNIYVPSWDADIMNLLGDADFDGDTIGILLGDIWVKLYSQIPNIFVDKGEQRKLIDEATVIFDSEIMQKAYCVALNNGNKAIGQVVIYAYMLACVRQDVFRSFLAKEIWEKMLHIVTNVDLDICYMQTVNGPIERMEYDEDELEDLNKGRAEGDKIKNRAYIELFKNNNTYKRMFAHSEVCDADAVDRFIQNVYDAGITSLNNLVDILADMAIVLSTVACRVIDSAKKPESVHVPLFGILRQLFRAGMTQRVNVKVVDGKVVYAPIKTGFITVEDMVANLDTKEDASAEDGALVDTMKGSAYRGTFIYVTNDQMCIMKNLLGKYLAEKLQSFLEDTAELAAQGVDTAVGNVGAVASLSSIATLYNAVMVNDKDSIDMMKPYFVAMARQLTKGFPQAFRMKYLLEACKRENEETHKKELVNKFWKDFVPELVHFALAVDTKTEDGLQTFNDFEISEELYSFDDDTVLTVGEKVKLEGGRDKHRRKAGGLFTAEKLNGSFTVGKRSDYQALVKTSVIEYADQFYSEDDKKFVIQLDMVRTIEALKVFKAMFSENEYAYIDLNRVDHRSPEYAERYGEAASFASTMLRRFIAHVSKNNGETRFVLDAWAPKNTRGHLQVLCKDNVWRDLAVFYIPWGERMLKKGNAYVFYQDESKQKEYYSKTYLDMKLVACEHVLCVGEGENTKVLVAGSVCEPVAMEQADL